MTMELVVQDLREARLRGPSTSDAASTPVQLESTERVGTGKRGPTLRDDVPTSTKHGTSLRGIPLRCRASALTPKIVETPSTYQGRRMKAGSG